ncbi:Enhancer of polycomb-like protein 1 [Bienertia sinuspersici]
MEKVMLNYMKLLILVLVFVLIAAADSASARMLETVTVWSTSEVEDGRSDGRVHQVQVISNSKEGDISIPKDELVDVGSILKKKKKEKEKEKCIKKGYPCEPYAKCCNACVVDPHYGFYVCS